MLLRPNPASNEIVANGVGDRVVEVTNGRHIAVLGKREVKMTAERLLNVGDILDECNAANGYLLAWNIE